MDNEQRADLGLLAVRAAARREGAWRNLDPRTAISDVLADIAHLCDRLGLEPGAVFDHSLNVHQGDSEDAAAAKVLEQAVTDREQQLDGSSLATYFEKWELQGPAAEPDPAETELLIRHPDHELERYGVAENNVIEIDLSREFDREHGFVMLGAERCSEILDQWREHLDALPAGGEAHRVLDRLIAQYEGAAVEEWGTAIVGVRERPSSEVAVDAGKVTVLERARKVLDRMNAGALPSEAMAAEGSGEDEVYSEDSSIFELDDPDNDLIAFRRSPEGETVLLKRSLGDHTQWMLEQRVEHQANKVEAMTEPERKEYNGWSTYETWATGMFLDGNYTGEGTYREVQQMTTRLTRGLDENSTGDEIVAARDELAVELQAYVVDHFATTMPEDSPVSMEGDLLAHALGEINWMELADNQLSAAEIEVPNDERAAAELEPNAAASPTSVVNKALSGHYEGAAVIAEAQQRVRHAAAQDAEYPAVRAADALKDYVDETRRLEGGGSLADDLIGASLRGDVDWMALAKQRLPEPPAPAGSQSPSSRPARDAGTGTDPGIGR